MADLTPPDHGAGHGELKRASERLVAKAEGLDAAAAAAERGAVKAEGAAKRVGKAAARTKTALRDARARLDDLNREYDAARKTKLTPAQRDLLAMAAEQGERGNVHHPPPSRGRTADLLERQGLIQAQATKGGGHIGFVATEVGRGVHDPNLILGDVQKQKQYIAELEDRAKQAARATRATKKQAGDMEKSAGDTAKFNKQISAELAAEAEALVQHRRAYQRRIATGDTGPTTAQERAAAQRTLAAAQPGSPLVARSAGGGARGVLEHIALVERQQERAALAQAEAQRAARRAEAQTTASAGGEQTATTAVRGKAAQAKRAAEWLEKQNVAMRDAAGASQGERVAAEAVERKALAAERAVVALREQNRLMRSTQAHAAIPGTERTGGGLIVPAGLGRDGGGRRATADAGDVDYAAAARQREAELGASARNVGRAFNYQIAQTGLLDQAFRKHGALTTEFISAAARGEASYREWGYQIGATAAKFAGWTAVSIPVFAALDGVRKIGEGAIQSASGVATLGRFFDREHFDPTAAREGFRAVSTELNVGIGDVSDAQAQFARVFHNQADSLTATRVALLATKLDQIDAADSFRYFTAIVQEGQVPIERLPILFDQISAAQRRMGARAAETLPAVARSFGAVRNAGGDLSELLALTATTQIATGQSGSSVGTAFYRGAATFFPRADNQATLRRYGIDPAQGFTQALIDGVRESSKLSGEQRRQISQAFFGPQYGGRFAALFTRAPQLNKALDVTSPAEAAGSAAEELREQLKRLDEQIATIGHDLERLGSNLGQSGFIDPLLGMGTALHEAFRNLNGFLGLWGLLPGPIQHSLGLVLEMMAALRIMRRFNIGDALIARAPALAPVLRENDERRAGRLGNIGLRRRAEYLQDEAERTSVTSTRATARAFTAHARMRDAIEKYPEATRTADQQRHISNLGDAYDKALIEAQGLAGDTDALRREMKLARIDMAEFRKVPKHLRVAWLAERNVFVPPHADMPSGERPIRPDQIGEDTPEELRELMGANQPDEAMQPPQKRQSALRQRAEARRNAARVRLEVAQAQRALDRGPGLSGALSQEAQMAMTMRKESVALRRGALLVADASVGAARGAAAAGVALRAATTGVKAATLGLFQLLGPEFLLITAALEIIPRVYNARKKSLAKHQENIVKANYEPASLSERNAVVAKDTDFFRQRGISLKQAEQWGKSPQAMAFLDKKDPELAGRVRQYHYLTESRPNMQAAQAAAGTTVTDRYLDEIKASYQEDFRRYQRGEISKKELFELQHKYALQARASNQANRGDDKAVNQFLRNLRTGRAQLEATSPWDRLRGYSEGQLGVASDANAARIAATGLTPGRVTQQLRIAHALAERASVAGDPQAANRLRQEADAALQVVTENITKELQEGLLLAHSQKERGKAYQEAIAEARALPSQAAAREATAQAEYDRLHANHLRNTQIVGSTGDHYTPQQRKTAQAELDQERAAKKRRDSRRQERQTLERLSAVQVQQLTDQQYQEAQDTDRARTDVANARSPGDAVGNARRNIEQTGRAVRAAIKRYGRGSKEALDAIKRQEDAYNEETSAEMQHAQAVAGLRAARSGTDSGSDAETRKGLLNSLAILRKSKNYKGPDDDRELDLLKQVAELDKSGKERRKQAAVDYIGAKYDLIRSTLDPSDAVAIAKVDHQQAQAVLRRGGFKNAAERMRAQADEQRTRIAERQTRQNEYVNHLDFLVSIGKLTTDQEVAALQRYLKTVKANKGLRERIQQQIYQLQHGGQQGDFDVNPANIRLPTVTELRRTIAGGSRGVTQQNTTTVQITVNGPQDYDRLGRVLERTHKGSGKALARAAGAR